MIVPARLSDWSFETIQKLCFLGVPESDRHDFKAMLPKSDVLTKLACAFANTYGGYVILGVHERGTSWNPDGVDPNPALYAHFIQKIRVEPSIAVPAPLQITVPESAKQIYIFEVPRSTRRPHLPIPNDERIFWKRVGSECVQMSREEVRSQMAEDETKRELLGLLILELRNILWSLSARSTPVGLQRSADGILYSFEIVDRVTVEAYSLLKDAPDVIKVLTTLKSVLMNVNADTQRNLSEQRYGQDYRLRQESAADHQRSLVAALPQVEVIVAQVERSLEDHFGLSLSR